MGENDQWWNFVVWADNIKIPRVLQRLGAKHQTESKVWGSFDFENSSVNS